MLVEGIECSDKHVSFGLILVVRTRYLGSKNLKEAMVSANCLLCTKLRPFPV